MELLILPALIFLIYVVNKFSTKPHLAIAYILLGSLVNIWFYYQPLELGVSILPHDVVFVPLLISALYRLIFKRQFYFLSILWCIYGLLLFSQLIAGVKMLGTVAIADFRSCFFYWTGALYFMSFQYSEEDIDKLVKYWLWMSLILLAIVYFRFVADLLNLPIAQEWRSEDTTGVRFRVVSAGAAYLLSIAIVMLFYRYIQPSLPNPSKLITVLLIVAVIVLQHRSVWAATITAILSSLLLPGIKNSKVFGNLTMIAMIGAILLLPLLTLGYADKILSSIADSAEKATNLSTGTFGGRVKGWGHIIDYWQHQSFLHQYFGDPFGTGYAGGKTAPHNFYFQALLRVGVLGALVLLVLYLSTILSLYFYGAKKQKTHLYALMFLMLLIGQQAYYIPYGHQAEHGIILGLAISLVKRRNMASIDAEQRTVMLGKPRQIPGKTPVNSV